MPDFWLGMLLLGMLAVRSMCSRRAVCEDPAPPATGLALLIDQAHHMALPAIALTLAYLGEYTIVMRSSMLDTVREDYLHLARAKGLRDADVRRHHAVPNALLPVVSLSALNFGFVLSGAIAVESIYSWPVSARRRSRRSVGPTSRCCRGCSCCSASRSIVANLAVDLFYGYLDPRVADR